MQGKTLLSYSFQANEIYVPLRSEVKLKNGVLLIRVHVHQPSSFHPNFNSVNTKTRHHFNLQALSEAMNTVMPFLSEENQATSLNFHSTSMNYLLPPSMIGEYVSIIREDSPASSGATTDFDIDRAGNISFSNRTASNHIVLSTDDNEPIAVIRVTLFLIKNQFLKSPYFIDLVFNR